jgi:hypothetical protein
MGAGRDHGAGEILVPYFAAVAANLGQDGLERRSPDLKGKSEPVPVLALTSYSAAPWVISEKL